MSKKTRITVDAATVKIQGQDIVITPKRITMFLTAIILGLAGIGLLLLGGSVLIGDLAGGDLKEIGSTIAMMILSAGLVGVAYFAFNKGKSQKAIHFDATNRQVIVGEEIIPFDSVMGVYLQRIGRATVNHKSSIIVQTGIISGDRAIPIVSVSKPGQQNMSDVATLLRLYAQHLEHDPKVVGRYEDLIQINLSTNAPVILSFKPNT